MTTEYFPPENPDTVAVSENADIEQPVVEPVPEPEPEPVLQTPSDTIENAVPSEPVSEPEPEAQPEAVAPPADVPAGPDPRDPQHRGALTKAQVAAVAADPTTPSPFKITPGVCGWCGSDYTEAQGHADLCHYCGKWSLPDGTPIDGNPHARANMSETFAWANSL